MDYEHDGTRYGITLAARGDGQFTATIGGRTLSFSARRLPDGGWLIDLGGRQQIVYAAQVGEQRQVFVDGENYTLTVPRPQARRRDTAAHAGDLTAQMPGQVIAVLVAVGETVSAGQTLVILEAMKMEMRITAPAAGVVRGIDVAVGAVVARGQRLVELGDIPG